MQNKQFYILREWRKMFKDNEDEDFYFLIDLKFDEFDWSLTAMNEDT